MWKGTQEWPVEPPVSQTQLEVSRAEQEPTAEQVAAENEEDEHSTAISPLPRRASRRSRGLDKDDRSLHKNKDALLGCVAVSADPNVPSVVTCLTLVCGLALGPLELDLTGDLESFKK